jgi:hypothetical protein
VISSKKSNLLKILVNIEFVHKIRKVKGVFMNKVNALVLSLFLLTGLTSCSFFTSNSSNAGTNSSENGQASSTNSSIGAPSDSSSASSTGETEVQKAAEETKNEFKVEPFAKFKNKEGQTMPYVVNTTTTTDGKDQYQVYAGLVRRVPVQITDSFFTDKKIDNYSFSYSTDDFHSSFTQTSTYIYRSVYAHSKTEGSTSYAAEANQSTTHSVELSAGVTVGYLNAGISTSGSHTNYSGITSGRSNSWSYENASTDTHEYSTFNQVLDQHEIKTAVSFSMSDIEPGYYRYGTFVDCDMYLYAQVYVRDSVVVVDDLSVEFSPIVASTMKGIDYTIDKDFYDLGRLAPYDITETLLKNLDYTAQQKYEDFSAPTEATPSSNFNYKDGVILGVSSDKIKDLSEVRIPGVIDGKPITTIGEGAFKNDQYLRYIFLPSTIVEIRGAAFRGCANLARVEMGANVQRLDEFAFYGCSHLRYLNLPSSLKWVSRYVFDNDVRLPYNFEGGTSYLPVGENAHFVLIKARKGILSLNIHKDTKIIAGQAFEGCNTNEELKITLPDGLISIGPSGFSGCSLQSIALPSTLQELGDHAFAGCALLANAVIPNTIPIPNIPDCLFDGCASLTGVTIPESVTSIGTCAFSGCSALTSISIPKSVTSIGFRAFSGCASITSVVIPDGVTDLEYAFSGCVSLTSVVIPDSVTKISGTFGGCTSLVTVAIPSGVTCIGMVAFSGCVSLKSIAIPSGVTEIDSSAFSGCVSLKSIAIPSGVTEIDSSAFSGCTGLTSFAMPSSLESIGSEAFSGCTGLTSITLPDALISLFSESFKGCISLTSFSIPSSLATIGSRVFMGCDKLLAIDYSDAMDKFKMVTNDRTWNEDSSIKTVHCTDGDLAL